MFWIGALGVVRPCCLLVIGVSWGLVFPVMVMTRMTPLGAELWRRREDLGL